MKTALGRRLLGFLATVVIAALLVGLPWALLALGAHPFAGGIPSWTDIIGALTAPDDGTLLLALIKLVAWLAWALLALTLTLEIAAQLRGVQAPRLPGLQLPQGTAHRLVRTAALLFLTLPLGAGVANAAPPPAAAPTVAPATPETTDENPSPVDQAAPITATPPSVRHVVQPGETLWKIAETHLGDGHRYTELVDLNTDLLGGRPSFLKPGWVLTVPAPADAATGATKTVVVQPGDTLSGIAQRELGDPARYPEIVEATEDVVQPGGRRLVDPDVIDVGWTLQVPTAANAEKAPSSSEADNTEEPAGETPPQPEATATVPTAAPAADGPAFTDTAAGTQPDPAPVPTAASEASQAPNATPPPVDTPGEEEHLSEHSGWVAATATGVGALVAAGVIRLVTARRGEQQRLRRPGTRLPMPHSEAAASEHELRSTADPLSVDLIDTALRSVAAHSRTTGAALPDVRAARLTATQFDLYLAEPAPLPAPWKDQLDHTVWTLDVTLADTLTRSSAALTDTPAPYPALVTIGHDEEQGHVLLNLEHLGALGVTGDDLATREVIAALAVELATCTWADDLQVTVVGAFADLEDALQTGRIRYLPSLGRVLADLEARADADQVALTAVHGDLNTARASGVAPDTWVPEILLLPGELTPAQQEQLKQLTSMRPRIAAAAVTAGVAVGEWNLHLSSDDPGVAVLEPIGLQVTPQRLPSAQYGHLLEVTALAAVEELPQPAADLPPEPTLGQIDTAPVFPPSSETPVGESPWDGSAAPGAAGAPPARPASEPGAVTRSPSDFVPDSPSTAESGDVMPPPVPSAPRIAVLGPVEMVHAQGTVEPSKRARLLELAAYLACYPGATASAIDNAIWPERRTEDNLNTRNTATSKLRRWAGSSPEGDEYLPRHQAGSGYAFSTAVTTDLDDWDTLIKGEPLNAPTDGLEAALGLVRGIPFEGTHPRRYAWAEPLKQRLISEIVDASYELTRRRLMEGQWRAAEQAVVLGLRVEPAHESLWRLRILAAHESRNMAAEAEAINRLLVLTEQLECDLEPETEQLLSELKLSNKNLDQLLAHAQ